MINLNLIADASDRNPSYEFYKDELPVRFLADLKDINIIVGANNSRKSRFLRSIISLENKLLVCTETDLNTIYNDGLKVCDTISGLKDNGIAGDLVLMRIYASENKYSQILNEYFDSIKSTKRILSAENMKTLIKDINYLTLTLSHQDPLNSLNKKLIHLETAAGLILYLYKHVKSKGNILVDPLSYPDGVFCHMEPVVPGIESQGRVSMVNEVITAFEGVLSWTNKFKGIKFEVHKNRNIYIPVLRTSRSLSGSNNDVFQDTLKKQHFNGELPRNLEVETGLKLYDKIHHAKNGLTIERTAFTEFEHFIGLTFFKSKDIHIVAHADRSGGEKTIRISIPGQKDDVPIYDLGDGVQGIINLLFPIFTAEKGDWLFIDEPENHLHPGYQTIFIRAISENLFLKEKELRYFINTHSNHMLSEAFMSPSDTGIYVFSNRDSNSSNIYSFMQNQYSTLELLGVMNTSVFVTNCTIWVEGITDRFYLRAFLHAYCNSLADHQYRPSEGYDYSFIEYAGKNLVHYDFDDKKNGNIGSYFLNSNVFLLADSDFDQEKHKKYEKINRPNFVYHKTHVPEIENLIPELILKKFLLEELHCDPKSVELITSISPNAKLGEIFNAVTRNRKKIKIEASHGGTLSSYYKSKLSKYVYDHFMDGNITWADLSISKPLKTIIESMYQFIQQKNGK